MSNSTTLSEYLLEKKDAYLLDTNNNGKTIMLSGAWGSGKTHFWKKEITPNLKNKLNGKACVYVSLYGKDSLDSLKKEILINASPIGNLLSKEVASFGYDTLSSIKDSNLKIGNFLTAFADAADSIKSSKGAEALKDGGIICFDDFERKSNKINLNDLFGFISQLAIELHCKIIIILNSDIFTGKDAEIFKNVKEKTISKFFYFNPSINELFKSISKNTKYNPLELYKKDILNAIKETEELNARIYIQALDNCLEWLNTKRPLDTYLIRVLVLGTFNFGLNHLLFDYNDDIKNKNYTVLYYPTPFRKMNSLYALMVFHGLTQNTDEKVFFDKLKDIIFDVNQKDEANLLDNEQQEYLKWIYNNELTLKALWKYGYRLYYTNDVGEEIYNEIKNFINTGVLL
jgi:hypothetical protein